MYHPGFCQEGKENPGRKLPRGGEASEATGEVSEWKNVTHWCLSLELHTQTVLVLQSLKEKGPLLPPKGVTFFLNDFEVLLRKLRRRETSGISIPLSNSRS